MKTYVILLRGINVGGKNRVPMAELKGYLEQQGCERVVTYIQSGNAILRSNLGAKALSAKIEGMLPKKFKLHSAIVKVAALEYKAFKKIVMQAPKGFGSDTQRYRYNVIFLMNFSSSVAMQQVDAREGVDQAWKGDKVIYFRNSIKEATKSRLSKITQQPVYKSITIRNWNTTTKLLKLLEEHRENSTK